MRYTAEDIERTFRSVASIRIYGKKPEHTNDAGYWTGGRCQWGANHNLKEDCQLLASFFSKITDLKNTKNKITKFENQEEFEKNKQELVKQCQGAINGLQVRTGNSSSIGGVCIIWADYSEHLDNLINNFRRDLESLSGEVSRITYDVAKKLRKLQVEEKIIKRQIEENLQRAQNEQDPNKKAKLLILVEDDKKKLQTNLEEQKKIRVGENFNPDSYIEEFLKGVVDKLAGRNRTPRDPREPTDNINLPGSTDLTDPGGNPNGRGGSTFPNHQPQNPWQPNQTPVTNTFQLDQQTLILIAGATLIIFFLMNQKTNDNYDY